jgi:hypothetical protein
VCWGWGKAEPGVARGIGGRAPVSSAFRSCREGLRGRKGKERRKRLYMSAGCCLLWAGNEGNGQCSPVDCTRGRKEERRGGGGRMVRGRGGLVRRGWGSWYPRSGLADFGRKEFIDGSAEWQGIDAWSRIDAWEIVSRRGAPSAGPGASRGPGGLRFRPRAADGAPTAARTAHVWCHGSVNTQISAHPHV